MIGIQLSASLENGRSRSLQGRLRRVKSTVFCVQGGQIEPPKIIARQEKGISHGDPTVE